MQLIRPFFEKGVRGLKPSLNHKMIFKRTITVKEITGVTFKKGVFGLKVTNLLESKPSVQKNFVPKIDY